jgi:hypothetical protein
MVDRDIILRHDGKLIYWNNKPIRTGVLKELQLMDATGGTITTDGDYRIHTFTEDGVFEVIISGTCEYLIVGGGGGQGGRYISGNRGGGGGGAGGLLWDDSFGISIGSYNIGIGNGGLMPTGWNSGDGTDGGDTNALGFTAYGGGRGGTNSSGYTGGSGGGAGAGNVGGSGGAGTEGPPRQGYNGASAGTGSGTGGGGGGGATGPGSSGSGASFLNNTNYGGPGYEFYGEIYAEGGQGGAYYDENNINIQPAPARRANSGSGGHGWDWSADGGGADGIVIIRYKYK